MNPLISSGAAQEDVLRLEIEAEELSIEIERLRGQTVKTAAQLPAPCAAAQSVDDGAPRSRPPVGSST